MKLAKRKSPKAEPSAAKERKREHASEVARRELRELSVVLARQRAERGPSWPGHVPPPVPGTWPTSRLEELLNLAAEKQFTYAYTWVLQLWLRKQGITVPTGVFSKNVFGPGTGPQPSKEKTEIR